MYAKPLMMNFLRTSRTKHAIREDQAYDLQLVGRVAARDETALHEIYSIYGQRLYTYALRLTADPALAEDVVQDALVAVWNQAASYRGEGRLAAWLMGIIHHTAVKSLRHRSSPITDSMENNLQGDDPLPEEQTLANQQTALLRQSLQRLSPEHRAVLELVFYQGLSLQETAQICDCPVGTVKSRLSYARRQMRGLLSRTEKTE